MKIEITKATVILTKGADTVLLAAELPPSMPFYGNDKPVLKLECAADTGADYVRDHLQLVPEIISSR